MRVGASKSLAVKHTDSNFAGSLSTHPAAYGLEIYRRDLKIAAKRVIDLTLCGALLSFLLALATFFTEQQALYRNVKVLFASSLASFMLPLLAVMGIYRNSSFVLFMHVLWSVIMILGIMWLAPVWRASWEMMKQFAGDCATRLGEEPAVGEVAMANSLCFLHLTFPPCEVEEAMGAPGGGGKTCFDCTCLAAYFRDFAKIYRPVWIASMLCCSVQLFSILFSAKLSWTLLQGEAVVLKEVASQKMMDRRSVRSLAPVTEW